MRSSWVTGLGNRAVLIVETTHSRRRTILGRMGDGVGARSGVGRGA